MAPRGRSGRQQPREPHPDTLPVLHLRDTPLDPITGEERGFYWLQGTETMQLRLPLTGEAWAGVGEEDFEVEASQDELQVRLKREDAPPALQGLNGVFKYTIEPHDCRFFVERDSNDPTGATRNLVVQLAKCNVGTAWTDGIFTQANLSLRPEGHNLAEKAELVPVKAGRQLDIDDPFVVSRASLCAELEDAQTNKTMQFRIVLTQKGLDAALDKVPYYRLFGMDVSERYLKVFIRGDEHSPILLGELGGRCIPDHSTFTLTTLTRKVEGHRIEGTMETVPCLEIVIAKSVECRTIWNDTLLNEDVDMNQVWGSLEEFEEMLIKADRDPSPDRDDWTPDDFADEEKERGNKAFKEGNARDAVVYYSRALRYTPNNHKILSNRSAAYSKLGKFQLALDDAEKALGIDSKWPKIYFRKGAALRSMRRWDDAILCFQEGQTLDGTDPDWDREIQKTKDEQSAHAKRLADRQATKQQQMAGEP